MSNESPLVGLVTEYIINLVCSWALVQYSPVFLSPYVYIILLPYRVVESYWSAIDVKLLIFLTTLFLVLIFDLVYNKLNKKIKDYYLLLPLVCCIFLYFEINLRLGGEHGTPEYFFKYYPFFIIESIVIVSIIHYLLNRFVFGSRM